MQAIAVFVCEAGETGDRVEGFPALYPALSTSNQRRRSNLMFEIKPSEVPPEVVLPDVVPAEVPLDRPAPAEVVIPQQPRPEVATLTMQQ